MGFGTKAGKYKKVILAVFPNDINGDIQMHNMGKLVHFCELTPQKLPKVSTFLEKRVDSDLAKGRLGYVEVSMKIFNELIRGCRKHLPLFAGSIVKLMKVLFEKNEYPELKIIATETFTRFADVQDDTTQYAGVEEFVNYFVAMCNNDLTNEITRKRLRIEGLRGLRAYIGILDLADELDSFVSKQSQGRMIPTILDNMQYPEPEGAGLGGEAGSGSVSTIATEVLKDLASRVNNITVTSVVSAVLNYLDSHNKWIPNTFAIHCLQTISYSLKPQHNQIMMTRILQHLEVTVPRPTPVVMQIVATIAAIVSDSTGPVTAVLSSLLKLLVVSVELSAQTPPPQNIEEQLALQATLVECVGTVSKKFPSGAQKMEAMGYILAQCEEVRLRAGSPTLALVLAECVLAVGGHLLPSDGGSVPGSVVSALMELAANPDPQVRILAQRSVHCILLPGRSLEQLAASGATDDEWPLARYSPALRESLYTTALMKTNQPENFVVLYHTLSILLLRSRSKELPDSIQLIFKLQHKSSKKRFPLLQSRSIHTVVAAYLLLVAKLYEYTPLEEYVNAILVKREEDKQVCRYLELKREGHVLVTLTVKKPKYSDSTKHRAVSVFFDREQVVELLCNIPSLSREYGKTLKRALSRTYTTRTRTRAQSTTLSSPPVLEPPFARPALTTPVSSANQEEIKEDVADVPLLNHAAAKSLNVEALRKALVPLDSALRSSDSHSQQVQHNMQSVTLLLATQHYHSAAAQCDDAAQARAKIWTYGTLHVPPPPHYDPASFEHTWQYDDEDVQKADNASEDYSTLSPLSALSLDLSHALLAH